MTAYESGPTPQQGRLHTHPQSTEDWLTWLYGEEPRGLLWVGGHADHWHGRTFATAREAAAYAQELDARGGVGVYFRLTTLREGVTGRGKAEDSAALYALAMDLDLRGPNHVAGTYPETEDDLRGLLKRAGLPEPSAWVHSGGGRYPFWTLAEPVDLTEPSMAGWAASVSGKLHAHVIEHAKASGWKIDNTRDLARVYRLPGTTNRKGEPVVCTVQEVTAARYTLAELESAILAAPKPEAEPEASPFASPADLAAPRTSARDTGAQERARIFTERQAQDYVSPYLDRLRAAQDGEINTTLNTTALVLGHFVPEFWTAEQVQAWCLEALQATEYDGRTWQAENTIASALRAAERDWKAERATEHEDPPARSRRVDLTPYLDGTYVSPAPERGGYREDGARLLYPGKWHSVIALTGAGKSWHGAWHALQEMRSGAVVAYAHFEEHSPAGTLDRLLSMGATRDELAERFVWLDCSRAWKPGEFAEALPAGVALVILDGINAACSQHGWPVDKPEAVGAYRSTFVTPAAVLGAAVLSLGHPPKARDRQGERHGFGSTAWLDEVDGVGFRLEAAKRSPVRRGRKGYSSLYSVKDRYGQVEARGELEESREAGWYYLGAFTVDSTPERDGVAAYLTTPVREDAQEEESSDLPKDLRPVVEKVRAVLAAHPEGLTGKQLEDRCPVRKGRVSAALAYLVDAGSVVVETGPRNARIHRLAPEPDGQEESRED